MDTVSYADITLPSSHGLANVAGMAVNLSANAVAAATITTDLGGAIVIGGGSGVAGGLTSLSSQLGGALGYQTQMSGLSREISGFSQQAARATSQARLLGEVDVFAGRLNNSGIFDNFLSGGTVE